MLSLDLCGVWQVCQAGETDVLPAQVPGCVHTDLLAARRIDDPFYRDNETKVQWIGEVDWVYSRSFSVSVELLQHDCVSLRCEGLDTLATLTVNGVEIGRTDNMFRCWEFDVKAALHVGENELTVTFASTIPYLAEHVRQNAAPGFVGAHEVQGRSWIRKEPCSYGWDWGPILPSCGIWKPISVLAFNTARLEDVHIRQQHETPGQVTLHCQVRAEQVTDANLSALVTVRLEGQIVAEAQTSLQAASGEVNLCINNPQLWWPNGLGAHPLYTVTVTLQNAGGDTLDTREQRIGLRTLRLDRHADEWGESFQFVVNGVPFFAKGANWIPADSFVTRITREQYADLLQSAADANMNMLRSWGGGIYEADDFFDLCDSLGICVWQDFIFACSTYPTFDTAFLENIQIEFQQTVRRLRHHASLALWCGNNELEQGFVGNGWNDHQMSWSDYCRVFDFMLPDTIRELDPDHDYWPGSPHSPYGDRTDFNNPTCGDAHLWDVWHGRKPFEWYRTCTHRFNSEFGFQSFPEPKTVWGYTEPEDRNVTSDIMELHQRSGIGNTVIMQYMLDWFRLPTSCEMTLWLSQILQGMAMKYAIEHWRRSMPRGMGTLYWQLNDCWPVASWSSLDYHGRWKALQYMARDFNAPLLVSGVEDINQGTVELHVTNDLREDKSGSLRWRLVDMSGAVIKQDSLPVTALSGKSTLVTTIDIKEFLQSLGEKNVLLFLDLTVDGKVVSSNFTSFCPTQTPAHSGAGNQLHGDRRHRRRLYRHRAGKTPRRCGPG